MKNYIINSGINLIKKHHVISSNKEEIIRYGLEGIYLTITKTIVILTIALLFNCLLETIIFTFIYGLLRSFSYGIHAKKSWICWITSIIIFIFIPMIAKYYYLNIYIKLFLGFIGTLLIFKNSPADTFKRPIVSRKRRRKLKYISTFISLVYLLLSLITNQFISNCLIYSILFQNILISPLTYKLFKLPYNNYLSYLKKHPELNNL